MRKINVDAVFLEADYGMVFVNETSKQVKKYLLLHKDKFDRTILQWKEMTFVESIRLQAEWDKEKFAYFKIIYKD